MNNRKLLKKVIICFSILLSCVPVSCISGRATIIDTGGAIAAIGQQQAQLREEALPEGKQSTGNNKDGRCSLFRWKSVVSVSAGDQHTLGLTDSGKVLAEGNNTFGQIHWRSRVTANEPHPLYQ